MKTLTHDPKALRMSNIMFEVQKAQTSADNFPMEVSVGEEVVTLTDISAAHYFHLGLLLCLKARQSETKELLDRRKRARAGVSIQAEPDQEF
jgi:hypothetical protein